MVSRRLAWMVTLVGAFTMTVSYVDRATLAVLAPTVTKALGISESAYGWLASAFSIAYLVSVPVAGWWIERVGARRGLVGSVLVWSSMAALHALVPGFLSLFALRIALGIAEGPSFPGAAQTVLRVLPADDRPRGFGVLFTGSSIGGMIAPLLASFLFAQAGWRVAFLGTAVIGLLWVPLWIGVTRRSGVRALLDADAKRPAERLPFWEVARHPLMVRALLAVMAFAPLVGLIGAWGSKILVRTHHVEQAAVGGYLWLPAVCFDAGAILFGDLAARQRRPHGAPPRALFALATLLAATVALLPLATTPWQTTALFAVLMAGGGAQYTLVTSDLLARLPPASVGLASGIITAAQSLSLVIANPLIGRAVDAYGNYHAVAIGLCIWLVPGSLVWWVWRP